MTRRTEGDSRTADDNGARMRSGSRSPQGTPISITSLLPNLLASGGGEGQVTRRSYGVGDSHPALTPLNDTSRVGGIDVLASASARSGSPTYAAAARAGVASASVGPHSTAGLIAAGSGNTSRGRDVSTDVATMSDAAVMALVARAEALAGIASVTVVSSGVPSPSEDVQNLQGVVFSPAVESPLPSPGLSAPVVASTRQPTAVIPGPTSVLSGEVASSSREAEEMFSSTQTPVDARALLLDVNFDKGEDDCHFSDDNASDCDEHDMTDAAYAEYRRVNPGPIRPLYAKEFGPGSNAWETMTRRQRRLYHQRKAPTRPSGDSLHTGDGRPHDLGPPGGGPTDPIPALDSGGESDSTPNSDVTPNSLPTTLEEDVRLEPPVVRPHLAASDAKFTTSVEYVDDVLHFGHPAAVRGALQEIDDLEEAKIRSSDTCDRHPEAQLSVDNEDDSEDSDTTVGRMLQTIRRQERAGLGPDSGDVNATTDRDGPADPFSGPLVPPPPTGYEFLLHQLGILTVNSDGLRVLSDSGIARYQDFVARDNTVREGGSTVTMESAQTPFPLPLDTFPASASVVGTTTLSAEGGVSPVSGGASELPKEVTFVGKSPMVPDETGSIQYIDNAFLEHCAQKRREADAIRRSQEEDRARVSPPRGIFEGVPLPLNPYGATEVKEVQNYDDFATVGFEAFVGVNTANQVVRDSNKQDGDMFAHLQPGQGSSSSDSRHLHPPGRSAPDRAYTPRDNRPVRSSRTSIADPSKLGKPRPQDQVYAAALAASSPRVTGAGVFLDPGVNSAPPSSSVRAGDPPAVQGPYSIPPPEQHSDFKGGLPHVSGPPLTERQRVRHLDIPLPSRATFTHADIARASGVLSAEEIDQQQDIWRAACFQAADRGWDGVGSGPPEILGPSSVMEWELQALYVRSVYAEAQASSDARRLAVLGINPDGTRASVSASTPGSRQSRGGSQGGAPGGWGFGHHGTGPPPPPPPPGSSSISVPPPSYGGAGGHFPSGGGPPPPPPPYGVNVTPDMRAPPSVWQRSTAGKLVSELSRLEAFSGDDADWLAFKEDVFRVAGVNDLEQVLDPDYYQSVEFDARDNKLMYFLLQKAVSGSLTAHAHFKKARLLDGNGAYFELLNAYTMAAPAKAMLLLQELNLFRMEPGERLSVFGARLLKLFEDISLLEGDHAIHFKDTQKLNYLLSAIRHEPDLKETYVFIEQSQSRGTITFEEALTALTRRCESLRADQALAEGAGGRRQGYIATATPVMAVAATITPEDCDSLSKADLVALITTRNKRHQLGDTKRASTVAEGTACLVKDCMTLCLMPICPIHYAEMVCGKTPRLPLKRSWGVATYEASTRKTIFPAAVPVAETKRVRTQRPKKN